MANDREFDSITCSELIKRLVARQRRLSYKDVKMAVHESLDYMSEALSRGKRIEVRGFGSFSLRFREPRVTRNPKTRQAVAVSGRSIPHFKPSSLLAASVDKSTGNARRSERRPERRPEARAAEPRQAPWDDEAP